MNKPVWIVCEDKLWLEKVLTALTDGDFCPVPLENQSCPRDAEGNYLQCSDCWKRYIETEVAEDE